MDADRSDTEDLLRRAGRKDGSALRRLFDENRVRLRRMVSARLDRRLAARVDPSDVVQETLTAASRLLPQYLLNRPLPFHAWLRKLAFHRLGWWHRAHLGSASRNAARERRLAPLPSSEPTMHLVDAIAGSDTSPSDHATRNEECARVLLTLEAMAPPDREVLNLRYVEGLSFAEIADRLGVGLGAAKMRHLRALERFKLLTGFATGETSQP